MANPKASISPAADRVILKCLEKDKNNRFADVSQLSGALTELMTQIDIPAYTPAPPVVAHATPQRKQAPAELIETRRGEMPNLAPPAMPHMQQQVAQSSPGIPMHPGQSMGGMPQNYPTPVPMSSQNLSMGQGMAPQQMNPQYPAASSIGYQMHPPAKASKMWLWVVIALLALGAAAGAVLAIVMK